MTPFKSFLNIALLAIASALPLAAHAQAATLTDGEVRKIDKEQKKITLKHGEIKNLDMPPMTMVFLVRDAAMLDGLKPGDKVKFAAEMLGPTMIVTEIRVAN